MARADRDAFLRGRAFGVAPTIRGDEARLRLSVFPERSSNRQAVRR